MAVAAIATLSHDVMPPQDKVAVSSMLPSLYREAGLRRCSHECFQRAKHSIAKFCVLKVDRVSRSVRVMQTSPLSH